MLDKKPLTAAELQSMGGKARAKALSKAERSAIARKAAKARAQKLTAAERSRIARKAVHARIAKHGQQRRNKPKAKKGGTQ